MKLLGANPNPTVMGLDELPGKANYFIGNDPSKWRTNVPVYAKVKYQEVYPGVDLIYYGNQRQLEYDFVVAPGTNPNAIRLVFEGADQLQVDAQGDLVLRVASGELRLHQPVIYQNMNGAKQQIAGTYALKGLQQVGFQVAVYDRSRPLVIDPVLAYATYLGGSRNDATIDIAVDAEGNAYLTGSTQGGFPTTPGAFDTTFNGERDAFVAKITEDTTPMTVTITTPANVVAPAKVAIASGTVTVSADASENVGVTGVQ